MDWEIGLSRQAEKFLAGRHLSDEFAIEPIQRAIRKLRGETVAIDLKRLSGKWAGFYRVRVGKIRIIFSIDFDEREILIEVVDNRGSAYR
jgi:mRNA interferase RelE/StbE